MKKLFYVLALLCTSFCAHAQFTFSSEPGPFRVGFRVVQQYDTARTYKGKVDSVTGLPNQGVLSRPVQTLVWYPTTATGSAMRVIDYKSTSTTEDGFDHSPALIQTRMTQIQNNAIRKLGKPRADAALAQRMLAVRDVQPAGGRFPVVIYAPGAGGNADENADMCEFLASHGYLVLASTSMAAHSLSFDTDHGEVSPQERDISFLIGYAQSLPQADMQHVGVIGFSWGGLAGMSATSKDNRITALVGLDASFRYFPQFVKQIAPEQIAVPLLFVSAKAKSIEKLTKDHFDTTFSLMNEMRYSDVYRILAEPLKHGWMTSDGVRFDPDSEFTDYSRAEVSVAHSWVMRYVRQFLDAHLKNKPTGLAFLAKTPVENGVPAHLFAPETQRANGTPPSREAFAAALAKRGFSNAFTLYQEFRKSSATFELAPNSLNGWGYALLVDHKNPEAAVAIFKLATELYPDDWNTFDSLAEAYEVNGNKALAIENYQRSIALNAKNENGLQHLKVLQE